MIKKIYSDSELEEDSTILPNDDLCLFGFFFVVFHRLFRSIPFKYFDECAADQLHIKPERTMLDIVKFPVDTFCVVDIASSAARLSCCCLRRLSGWYVLR